jgi:Subtilase family
MGQIHAFLQLDPDRAPEQADFLRSRVTVLREAGGQFWVSMDEAQVDTFLSQGFLVSTFPDEDVLQVGPVSYRPASETPQPPDALRATTPSGADPGFWIVHFIAPTDKSWLQEITLAGAEQVQVLDAFTGVFRMTSAVADSVRSLGYVDAVGIFHPAFAVGPDLAGIDEPLTAASLSALSVQLPPSVPEGNLQVRVFDALDPEGIRPALEAEGATVVNSIAHGFLVQAAPEAVNAILAVPGVFAASTPITRQLANHNAGVILGVNQVRDLGTVDFLVNLDGTGEIGAVVDSGFDVGNLAGGVPPPTGAMTPFHPDLVNNIRLLRNSTTPQNAALAVPDNSPHGTHVAGIVAGDGTSSAGLTRGMAPRAALVGLGPLPPNVRVPFDFAAANGARVVNNSWGSSFNVGVNNNRYTPTESQSVDRWCFDNPDVLILFAAGNNESDTLAGGDGVLDAAHLTWKSPPRMC